MADENGKLARPTSGKMARKPRKPASGTNIKGETPDVEIDTVGSGLSVVDAVIDVADAQFGAAGQAYVERVKHNMTELEAFMQRVQSGIYSRVQQSINTQFSEE
jgi:hypothetical protein